MRLGLLGGGWWAGRTLVLARVAAARTLLVAAGLAATVATVLLTAFLLYAQLLPVAGARAAIIDAPPHERTLRVTGSALQTPDELAARDAAVRELFAGGPGSAPGRSGLAGVPLAVSASGYASGQELPAGLVPDGGSAVVGFATNLPEHAELAGGGRWPEPVPAGEPVQATLPVPVADALGVAVGETVDIVDARLGERVVAPVAVVGVWTPVDPADPYWQHLAVPVERGGWGPFVVHEDEFVARYQLLATLEWLAVPDPAELAEVRMADITADFQALSGQLIAQRETDPALDDSVRFFRSGITDLADRLAVATVVNRSGMVLPAALLVVISGFGLVLVARLLAAHRRGENALLRARGASRRQLVRFTATESLLVVLPAAVGGAPAGSWLVGLADQRAGSRELGVAGDLAPYGLAGPPLAWVVALAAAAGCALALALPAAGRGRIWVAEQQERSRPGRAAALQRAGVDVALVALAVLAWTQLRQYGTAVAPTDSGQLGIDPLLVVAPVVGVLAATAVTLRLLPLATRWGVRAAARRDAFPGLLGMWQADRRPHAGPVLLLVLAVATAVLAPTVATTWQQSQRDQAAQQVGADLRVTVANPSASSGRELAGALPAATGLVPVHRGDLILPEAGATTLLALDSDRAGAVARLRPDLAAAGPEQLFADLRDGRPELTGLPLPAGAQRLVGRFELAAPEPTTYRFLRAVFDGFEEVDLVPVEQELPPPSADRLAVHVRDAEGLVRSVELGRRATDEFNRLTGGIVLDEEGGVDLDVALPPDAAELVGLGAGATAPGWSPELSPDGDAEPVELSWRWEDLQVVADDGARTPIEIPDSWQVLDRGDSGVEAERAAGEPAVTASVHPFQDYPLSLRFQLIAPPPELAPIPLVVTRDVLETTGAELGQPISVDGGAGGITSARLVGVVDAVPGTVDGTGAMVDLEWLSIHQFLWSRQPPAVSEWWLATPDRAAAAAPALRELAWTGPVLDRRAEAERLLDDPLGTGVLFTLWAAAAAAAVLAAFGLVVDSRSTAVGRRRELAVLHTLGTSPPALARALVVEQAVLAGLGVAAGVLVGVGVAAAMGPSLVLTPAGQVPVPAPLLSLSPGQFAAPTLGLFVVAVVLGALVARRARREVAAGALRIGEEL
jgi:hypothetical protein